MKFIITGRNIDVTEGLKTAVEEKIGKLERYFTKDTEIHVTLSVEKERQKIEVTIPVKGNIIRSEQTSTDMYVSIDLVEEVIERQLRKYKNKLVDAKQGGGSFNQEFLDNDYDIEDEVNIIRTKKFGVKPMFPEDACVQMELLGHNFYMFKNAETDEVNVVYKRKGNTYGLIEPEFQKNQGKGRIRYVYHIADVFFYVFFYKIFIVKVRQKCYNVGQNCEVMELKMILGVQYEVS